MSRTVAVIHGVANRDRAAFEALVGRLMSAVGTDAPVIPVFWGDLGAVTDGLDAAIPDAGVRAGLAPRDPETGLSMLEPGPVPASAERARTVADGFRDAVAADVRATDAEDGERAIVESWPALDHLARVGDEEVLREVGRAVAEATALSADAAVAEGQFEVRISLPDPREAVKRALQAIDHAVGAVLGAVGEEVNTAMRRGVSPGVGRFLGDVLVYQRNRAEIQARVRETLAAVDPGLGSREQPLDVFGHSLGGVIAFDLAAATEPPLWIDRLLTFGSQSAFLHVLDPRGAPLQAFTGAPVPLGPSIGRWVNLWEPLDPLAFVASRVFRLASGALPQDRAIEHLASYGLWTHSAYWAASDLIATARELLASGR